MHFIILFIGKIEQILLNGYIEKLILSGKTQNQYLFEDTRVYVTFKCTYYIYVSMDSYLDLPCKNLLNDRIV